MHSAERYTVLKEEEIYKGLATLRKKKPQNVFNFLSHKQDCNLQSTNPLCDMH